MLDVNLTITADTLSPSLRLTADGMAVSRILPVIARSVRNSMRENFDALEDERPNQLGGTRTHYYSRARALTSYYIEGDSAVVFTTKVGTNLRYYGGTVEAGANPSYITGQPTKYLTIPATAESYGKRAADFPELEVLWGRNGPYGLGRVTRRTITRGDSFGVSHAQSVEVLFWLRKSVTVPADPSMLPDASVVEENAYSDFGAYMDALWRREDRRDYREE